MCSSDLLQAFGYSLNILTLGAITISIGRVVDDSIVVIENIRRHYVGKADKLTSIVRAVKEVGSAITSSTITTVAVTSVNGGTPDYFHLLGIVRFKVTGMAIKSTNAPPIAQ